MRSLSIGEVSRRTGVRASALRYYEAAGILPRPARAGGRRWYDAAAIRRIDVLRFAQQAGFTLEEIKVLFHGFGADTPLSARWQSLVRKKLSELDLLAARVRRMRHALLKASKCGCIRIEDCLLSPEFEMSAHRDGAKASRNCSC